MDSWDLLTKSDMVRKWVQEPVYLESSPSDPEAGSDLETTNITFPFRHERTQEPKFVAHL